MQKTLATILFAALVIAAPHAQDVVQTTPDKQKAQTVPVDLAAGGQPVNIKLDVTITDQTGPGEPIRKVVTLIVADRTNGSIRSTGSVRSQGRVQINVDARPQILQSGAIRLMLGLEYNPRTLGNDASTEWSSLNEQLGVVLQPGKPLLVSQAADPASDRKITVELTATILK
ncbi:hypothetical protein BH24ACI5_BH24ACI5_15600 [soil metagenome]